MRAGRIASFAGMLLLVASASQASAPEDDAAHTAAKAAYAPDIYRGEAASSAVFTWQVGIARGPGGRCGGVVVSPYHVLTAAHCLDRADEAQVRQPLASGTAAQPHDLAMIRILHGSDTWETGRPIVARIAFHAGWRAPADRSQSRAAVRHAESGRNLITKENRNDAHLSPCGRDFRYRSGRHARPGRG